MDPGAKVALLIVGGITVWLGVRWVARRFFPIRDDPTQGRGDCGIED